MLKAASRLIMRRHLQVFAPTFPGYGRSEKPAMAYSQVGGCCLSPRILLVYKCCVVVR